MEAKLSIVPLAQKLLNAVVVDDKELGRRAISICPVCHNNVVRSFIVSDKKYSCFSCGCGGDILSFFTQCLDYTEEAAKDELNRMCGARSNFAEMEKRKRIPLYDANKKAAEFYHKCLYDVKDEGGKTAYSYLKTRGLSDETIKKFNLGYSRFGVCGHLKKQGVTDERIDAAGIGKIDDGKCKDMMPNRVIFPIIDENNEVTGFGGRLIVYPDPKYPNAPKYKNTPTTDVFKKANLLYAWNFAKDSSRPGIILCEGNMDVISLHQAGFDNAVATLGTACTKEHAKKIREKTDMVYLCFDSDDAGVKAKLNAIPVLRNEGIKVKILSCYPYKDPDELIKKAGAKAFEKVIEKAMDSYEYHVMQLKEMSKSDEDFKQAFSKLVINLSKEDFTAYVSAYKKLKDVSKDCYNEVLKGFIIRY